MADIYDYQGPQVTGAAPPAPVDIYSYQPGQSIAKQSAPAQPYEGDLSFAVQNAKAALAGEAKGAWDTLVEGPGQFVTRALASVFPGSEYLQHQVAVSDAGQQARQAAYNEFVQGHEQAASIGNVAGSTAAVIGAGAGTGPEQGANLVNRLIYATKFGAAAGGAQPVEDPEENFWGKKIGQTVAGGIGGLVGGVGGEVVGWGAGKLMQAYQGVKNWIGLAPDLEDQIPGLPERLATASDNLRQSVQQTVQNGQQIDPVALRNHLDADSVGVQLMHGQAAEDPVQISLERNNRGLPNDPVPDILNGQAKALQAKLENMKKVVAPDVSVADNYEAGQNLIASIQNKVDANRAATSSAYKTLADANGGKIPIDGIAFADQAKAELDTQMKGEFLPTQYSKLLDDFASGKRQMTFENFENLRTMLGATQRSASDGNVVGAASIVRNALENAELPEGAAALKPLADQARTLAKQGFDLERAIPAYKAVANGTAVPDNFVKNFVTGGNTQQLQGLVSVLGDDPMALQTIKAAYANDLQSAAGTSAANFKSATYNNRLDAFAKTSRKLDTVFSPDEAQQFRTVGRVGTLVNQQPAGSFVNNSNSAVALPRIAASAADLLEHGTNAVTRTPVGTVARNILTSQAAQREAAQRVSSAIAPGAGIAIPSPTRAIGPAVSQAAGASVADLLAEQANDQTRH